MKYENDTFIFPKIALLLVPATLLTAVVGAMVMNVPTTEEKMQSAIVSMQTVADENNGSVIPLNYYTDNVEATRSLNVVLREIEEYRSKDPLNRNEGDFTLRFTRHSKYSGDPEFRSLVQKLTSRDMGHYALEGTKVSIHDGRTRIQWTYESRYGNKSGYLYDSAAKTSKPIKRADVKRMEEALKRMPPKEQMPQKNEEL